MTAAKAVQADPDHRPQFGWINVLKAGAAQLIVLHHLAFYGPMSDLVQPMWPALIDWLGDSARIAVQVFLVIGGFLAAKSLAPGGLPGLAPSPLSAIWRRYAKLAPPFIAATLIAALANALASGVMLHDSISAPASVGQIVAHALLLHGVLGYESLSAGAWYVAIDFQLYALAALVFWGAGRIAGERRLPWLVPAIVACGVAASLLYFNLDADWDNWAPYFFGSYGLGMLAWWAGDPRRKAGAVLVLMLLLVVPAWLALAVEFRSRIELALAVACVLFLCGRMQVASGERAWPLINGLGRISYAVFLIHFPVSLLVNTAFIRFAPLQPEWQALGMLTAWAASLGAGAAFHRRVEVPLGRVVQSLVGKVLVRPVSV
ncbi:acyltransferase family protein [Janthinobacterium sp. J1-1]|uniref:acyltransferase family protein n=1 Tax=unclassified Janthinobacterium TaxID=2610881 RepID=UPI002811F3AA|nr:acyltransferase [Janthinobacterium sp. J1-1]